MRKYDFILKNKKKKLEKKTRLKKQTIGKPCASTKTKKMGKKKFRDIIKDKQAITWNGIKNGNM